MNRFFIFCVLLIFLLSNGVWASPQVESEITILCPWGVGSAENGLLLVLKPLLESETGKSVAIRWETGQGGIAATELAEKMPADGFHYFAGNQAMIMLDIKAEVSSPFRDKMMPVARLTNMTYVLSTSRKMANSAFTNYEELISYTQRNPREIHCGMLSRSGVDGLALEQIFPKNNVVPVQYDSGKQIMSELLNGNIQLWICGIGEIIGLIDRGDLIPLMVLDTHRLKSMPDVPCAKEYGLNMSVNSWCGIWAPVGAPPKETEIFASAIKRSMSNESWKKYLIWSSNNQHGGYMNQQQFENFIENEYGQYTALLTRKGLMKRFYGEMD